MPAKITGYTVGINMCLCFAHTNWSYWSTSRPSHPMWLLWLWTVITQYWCQETCMVWI